MYIAAVNLGACSEQKPIHEAIYGVPQLQTRMASCYCKDTSKGRNMTFYASLPPIVGAFQAEGWVGFNICIKDMPRFTQSPNGCNISPTLTSHACCHMLPAVMRSGSKTILNYDFSCNNILRMGVSQFWLTPYYAESKRARVGRQPSCCL